VEREDTRPRRTHLGDLADGVVRVRGVELALELVRRRDVHLPALADLIVPRALAEDAVFLDVGVVQPEKHHWDEERQHHQHADEGEVLGGRHLGLAGCVNETRCAAGGVGVRACSCACSCGQNLKRSLLLHEKLRQTSFLGAFIT
jgi:hypothetical protein